MGVVELGVLSWVPDGQRVEVEVGILAAEVRSQRLTLDVGTGFVVVMPVRYPAIGSIVLETREYV